MALPDDWLQRVITYETTLEAPADNQHNIGRAIIGGAIVVYDLDDIPVWLRPILAMRDEDGELPDELVGMIPQRKPRPGEYQNGDVASVLWTDFPDNLGIYEPEAVH